MKSKCAPLLQVSSLLRALTSPSAEERLFLFSSVSFLSLSPPPPTPLPPSFSPSISHICSPVHILLSPTTARENIDSQGESDWKIVSVPGTARLSDSATPGPVSVFVWFGARKVEDPKEEMRCEARCTRGEERNINVRTPHD
jgi:hypothetical protein